MTRPVLIVLAKEPVAGRVKTRLCPPLTPKEAATVAEAALHDTLRAAASVAGVRRLLVLDGAPGAWLPAGFEVAAQRAGGLGKRLAGAFAAAGGPAVLIGMDTPQVTRSQLELALAELARPAVDAALGPAPDGGYWTIGLRRPDERVFEGVPMSSTRTFAAQRRQLMRLGLNVTQLEPLRDVDTLADARAVAADAPSGRFASALAAL